MIDIETSNILYRHKCFCLWESRISSFINRTTHDLVTLSKFGMKITDLYSHNETKIIVDNKGLKHKLRALSSCDYFKLENNNIITYHCRDDEIKIIIKDSYKSEDL